MFYGRERELAAIHGVLDGARRSQSGTLLLCGEAGVGKSALLECARDAAPDMTVLPVRGVESEAQLPFAAVHQLVYPILGHIDALPEPQALALRIALGQSEGSGDIRFLVSLAVLSLLSEEAERRPVLCLVDDAHWLDNASADTLTFAARRLSVEGIALLLASREGELPFEEAGVPTLRVEGLDPEAAGALVDEHTPVSLSPEVRERLVEETSANPLALIELPQTLTADELTGSEPLLGPLPVSARIEAGFLTRARRLPEATQTLLLVAAAENGGSLPVVLRAAARLGIDPRALDDAERAGLVTIQASSIAFRHALTRSAIYHGSPLSRRQAAHEALAHVFDESGDEDLRAWHRAEATVEHDASIAADLEATARRALQRGGLAAASFAYERAATMSPDPETRGRLLLAATEHAWFAGRLERTRMLVERTDRFLEHPTERADLERWRGLVETTHGDPANAYPGLIRAATDVAQLDPERALYLLNIASVAATYVGETSVPDDIARRAEAVPESGSVDGEMLRAVVVGIGAHVRGEFDAARVQLRRALDLTSELDAMFDEQPPAMLLAGRAALFLGDDRVAQDLHRRAASRFRSAGALGVLTQALPRLAHVEVGVGRWSTAAASAEECVELGTGIGQHGLVAHALAVQALVAGLEGDEERCRSLVAESGELAAARRLNHVADLGNWALTVLALGLGRAEDAFQAATSVLQTPIRLWAALDRIEAAARAGDPAVGLQWLEESERWAVATGQPWALAVALHGHAVLTDDADEAEREFAKAIERHASTDRPFELARTHLALGEHLRRTRRRVEARDHLRAALATFEALHAAAWAERARVELRASGQTAMRRVSEARERLTPQELQVAQLVAQGLTNRDVAAHLYLSHRTIDFHLRNVFRKLDIASRTQLARVQLERAGGSAAATREADPTA